MILAHGTGIDDAAFVVLPLLVLAALRLFNRRRPPDGGGCDSQGVRSNDVVSS